MTYVPRGGHCEEFTAGETFTTAARTVTEGTVGDTIHRVRETRESSKPGRGVLVLDVAGRNQRGETVCQAEWTTVMARWR